MLLMYHILKLSIFAQFVVLIFEFTLLIFLNYTVSFIDSPKILLFSAVPHVPCKITLPSCNRITTVFHLAGTLIET